LEVVAAVVDPGMVAAGRAGGIVQLDGDVVVGVGVADVGGVQLDLGAPDLAAGAVARVAAVGRRRPAAVGIGGLHPIAVLGVRRQARVDELVGSPAERGQKSQRAVT